MTTDEKDETFTPCGKYFYYFAFGSNLLKDRIHLKNPTAEYVGRGKVDDYELMFSGYSLYEKCGSQNVWHGSTATIVRTPEKHVWGAVWKIHEDNSHTLDQQEVGYDRELLKAVMDDGSIVSCRTYLHNTESRGIPLDVPSVWYKSVIYAGAEQCGLPVEYIAKIREFPIKNFDKNMDVPELWKKVVNSASPESSALLEKCLSDLCN